MGITDFISAMSLLTAYLIMTSVTHCFWYGITTSYRLQQSWSLKSVILFTFVLQRKYCHINFTWYDTTACKHMWSNNLSLKIHLFYFMCMSVSLHICMCTTCVHYQRMTEEWIRYLRTDVVSYWWLWATMGCWESNLSPLQEQPMHITTEPLLQT